MNQSADSSVKPSSNKRVLLIVFVVAVLLLCCVATIIGVVFLSISQKSGNDTNTPGQSNTDGTTSTPWDGNVGAGLQADNFNQTQFNIGAISRTTQNPSRYLVTQVDVGLPNLGNITPPENKISWVVLNEVLLTEAAFRALAQSGWGKDGHYGTSTIRLSSSQLGYSEAQLAEMARVERTKELEQVIPDDLKPLYTTPAAGKELQALILKAYDEYYKYLQAKGVHSTYIEMMKKIVPQNEARVRYVYSGEDAEFSSAVHANEQGTGAVDYSVRYMDITSSSLFNDMKFFYNSRVLGSVPSDPAGRYDYHKRLRELITRNNVYHEATHILQRAYMQAYTPAGDQDEKTIHLFSKKTLATLDEQNQWRWSKITGIKHEEVTRTQESQSDGVAFEVLTNVYRMNDAQRNALWTHMFGRVDPSREKLFAIKKLLEDNWLEMVNKAGYPGTIAGIVFSGSDQTNAYLRKAMRRLDLPSYAGYLDTMRPEKAEQFWNTVQVYEPN